MTNTNDTKPSPTNDTKPSPIEVWLRQQNMAITCMVVREDETTYELYVASLSMRGAQREITGWLINDGYEPVGRWQVESDDSAMQTAETVRKFKLAAPAA
jgi:hypothetical protein